MAGPWGFGAQGLGLKGCGFGDLKIKGLSGFGGGFRRLGVRVRRLWLEDSGGLLCKGSEVRSLTGEVESCYPDEPSLIYPL